MYDFFIRLLYRVTAPGHPRGRVRMDAVGEEVGDTLWIHTHGMARWGLHEIEMVGVPYALRGYAHGLLFELMGYMKGQKPIGADETIAGLWVSEDQPAAHQAKAILIERPDDPDHRRTLRFIDLHPTASAGFPARLFAAHICSLAALERSPFKRQEMYQQATALVSTADDPDTDQILDNVNNWVAWEGLGSACWDLGRVPEAIAHLTKAAKLSPNSMRSLAEHVRQAIGRGELPAPELDPRSRFWMGLHP